MFYSETFTVGYHRFHLPIILVGKDEKDNEVIWSMGAPTKFNLEPLDHVEIGENMLDGYSWKNLAVDSTSTERLLGHRALGNGRSVRSSN